MWPDVLATTVHTFDSPSPVLRVRWNAESRSHLAVILYRASFGHRRASTFEQFAEQFRDSSILEVGERNSLMELPID